MRRFTLIGLAAVAAVCNADPLYRPHVIRDLTNSTFPNTTSSSSTTQSSTSSTLSSQSSSSSISSSQSSSSSSSSISASTNSSDSLGPTNSSSFAPTACTGCILQAYMPLTLTYSGDSDQYETTTKTIGTVIPMVITYEDATITTVTTVYDPAPTYNVSDPAPTETFITAHTFEYSPDFDVTLTFTSGTTYIAYDYIWGGADRFSTIPAPTCVQQPNKLGFFPPTDGNYNVFFQTVVGEMPPPPVSGFVSLPLTLIEYLQTQPEATRSFPGQNLASCTGGSRTPITAPFESSVFYTPPPPSSGFFTTPKQGPSKTFMSSDFATETTMHIQGSGCLRCPQRPINTEGLGMPLPEPPKPKPEPPKPEPPKAPKVENPNTHGQIPTDPAKNPSLPEAIASAIVGNPSFFLGTPSAPANNPGQSVRVGDSVFPIHPAQPTAPQNPQDPQNPQQPGVVVGSQTIAPGEVKTINGVVVSVPVNGGGSSVVIGGNTFAVNPASPTGPAVLTVGNNIVTANSNGQFVVGTQTLNPGGPAIVVSGTTLSLGPSGTIAVVNGATQVLANAPIITGAPALTVNGKVIPATVVGGSTGFVVAPGQTLTPGGQLVVAGTTYSLPVGASGSTVVVNGVTQTLGSNPLITGAPALTVNGKVIPATVVDGTTQFIVAPGKTLTPGGVLVEGGTTYSLPVGGSGSTVVVNGVTQTLGNTPVLSINGQSISATIVGGTTAFVLGPGQTLTPGGSLVISGTTISMPATASGSVVVINGVTSTLGKPAQITAAPALTIDGKTYSPSVLDGTTQYVLGPGTTLKPGQAVTISGTTFSLDPSGTALVINGQTSSIPKTPASNMASATGSSKTSSSSRSSRTSSSTSQRAPGNFIASGIGATQKKGGAAVVRPRGIDIWAEGIAIGFAGWLLTLL